MDFVTGLREKTLGEVAGTLATEGAGVGVGFLGAGIVGRRVEDLVMGKDPAGVQKLVTRADPLTTKIKAWAGNNVPKILAWWLLRGQTIVPGEPVSVTKEITVDAKKAVAGSVFFDTFARVVNGGVPARAGTGIFAIGPEEKPASQNADIQRLIQENSALRLELNKALQRLANPNPPQNPSNVQTAQIARSAPAGQQGNVPVQQVQTVQTLQSQSGVQPSQAVPPQLQTCVNQLQTCVNQLAAAAPGLIAKPPASPTAPTGGTPATPVSRPTTPTGTSTMANMQTMQAYPAAPTITPVTSPVAAPQPIMAPTVTPVARPPTPVGPVPSFPPTIAAPTISPVTRQVAQAPPPVQVVPTPAAPVIPAPTMPAPAMPGFAPYLPGMIPQFAPGCIPMPVMSSQESNKKEGGNSMIQGQQIANLQSMQSMYGQPFFDYSKYMQSIQSMTPLMPWTDFKTLQQAPAAQAMPAPSTPTGFTGFAPFGAPFAAPGCAAPVPCAIPCVAPAPIPNAAQPTDIRFGFMGETPKQTPQVQTNIPQPLQAQQSQSQPATQSLQGPFSVHATPPLSAPFGAGIITSPSPIGLPFGAPFAAPGFAPFAAPGFAPFAAPGFAPFMAPFAAPGFAPFMAPFAAPGCAAPAPCATPCVAPAPIPNAAQPTDIRFGFMADQQQAAQPLMNQPMVQIQPMQTPTFEQYQQQMQQYMQPTPWANVPPIESLQSPFFARATPPGSAPFVSVPRSIVPPLPFAPPPSGIGPALVPPIAAPGYAPFGAQFAVPGYAPFGAPFAAPGYAPFGAPCATPCAAPAPIPNAVQPTDIRFGFMEEEQEGGNPIFRLGKTSPIRTGQAGSRQANLKGKYGFMSEDAEVGKVFGMR